MRLPSFALAAACAVLPTLAAAQNRPVLEPTRDVAVTYRTTGGQRESRIEAAYLASQRLLRMDLPRQRGWGILDRRTGKVKVVVEGMNAVVEMPASELAEMGIPAEPGPNARFTREGTDRVAGLSCTNWRFEDGNRSGRACLTADGVLLRGEGRSPEGRGGVEAVQVTYAPQDPARFRVPSGSQGLQLPRGLPPGLMNGLLGGGRGG
ncbi:hypothetical protein [Roseomonas sp. BN140053]|uniref:hypothetical protein n=1 Tax=Roseomonas sp. BN140053 TaxID=3391898 RepID=UPI0039E83A1D